MSNTLQIEDFEDRLIVYGGMFEDVLVALGGMHSNVIRIINDDNSLSYEIKKDNYRETYFYLDGKLVESYIGG